MKQTVIIEEGLESGYVDYAPALNDCVSQGKTKTEALRNIKKAMEAYIEALLEDGLLCRCIKVKISEKAYYAKSSEI